MAANDLTIIRFHGERPEDVPAISPELLVKVCAQLENVYKGAAGSFRHEARVRYAFATTPRRGSLEIVLVHTVTATELGSAVLSVKGAGTDKAMIAEWVGIGISMATLIYQATFGGKGLLEHFLTNTAPSELTANPTPLETVKYRLSTNAISNPATVKAARELVSLAASSGAKTVEIEVGDEPTIVIYSSDARQLPQILTRAAGRIAADRQVSRLFGAAGPEITGMYRDEPCKLFMAQLERNEDPVLIIWMSKQTRPSQGQEVVVKGSVVAPSGLDKLKLDSPVPLAFDDVAGVVAIYGVATYS